ncbi:unnamed protein product [Sphagnum tenellum]
MLEGRTGAAAVQLSPTNWWVTGGRTGTTGILENDVLTSTEMFSVSERFSRYDSLPEAKAFPQFGEGQLYPRRAARRRGSDFPAEELYNGASVPYGNTFLVVGGVKGQADVLQNSIFIYQVEVRGWIQLPQRLGVARNWHAAIFVPEDFISC